jgi:hypothetical protein
MPHAEVLKLDFGSNDALENAAVNVDMPSFRRHPRGRNALSPKHRLDTSSRASSRRQRSGSHLKLRLRNTDPRSLDGDRRDVISSDPNPDLAVLAPIKTSRSLTLRTANRLRSSLVTKNLRSISTGPWCNCSFGRSNFLCTDMHRLRGLEGGNGQKAIGRSVGAAMKGLAKVLRSRNILSPCLIESPFIYRPHFNNFV